MKQYTGKPLLRAVLVITAMVGLASGVTFAALQSQNVRLANNSIESATANLQISTDGSNYGTTALGFDFANVEPGGAAVPTGGHGFYLKNYGTTNLALRLGVDGSKVNVSSGVDISKVTIILTPPSGSPLSVPLSTLVSSYASGGYGLNLSLASGASGQYKLQVAMTSDAISGPTTSGVTINGIEFTFNGLSLAS